MWLDLLETIVLYVFTGLVALMLILALFAIRSSRG